MSTWTTFRLPYLRKRSWHKSAQVGTGKQTLVFARDNLESTGFNSGVGTLLTDSETADYLRLTTRQVVRLAKRGDVPSVNLPDGELRFDAADLHQWVESLKRPVNGQGGGK